MTRGGPIRIGSRPSRLALVQSQMAMRALEQAGLGPLEIVPIRTRGDELSRRRPRGSWEETDGQFTSEIERRVADGDLDLAVHSLKDLPTTPAAGLEIVAVLERDDPRDCLVTTHDEAWNELAFGARIGTSSARRVAQLRAVRPDIRATPIRGNVETRIQRTRGGEYDGVLLAAAGIDRLGIKLPEQARLDLDLVLPAAGQGAIALQCRTNHPLRARLATVDHLLTREAVAAERSLLRYMGGGCLAPLGVYVRVSDELAELRAAWEDADGEIRRTRASGSRAHLGAMVEQVAAALTANRTPAEGVAESA